MKTFLFYLGFHHNCGTNTALQSVKTFFYFRPSHLILGKIQLFSQRRPFFVVFLFWSSLCNLSFGPPPILIWSPTKFRASFQSKILNWTEKTFFLFWSSPLQYVVWGPPQSKILATPTDRHLRNFTIKI